MEGVIFFALFLPVHSTLWLNLEHEEQQIPISLYNTYFICSRFFCRIIGIIGFFVFYVFQAWKINGLQKRNILWCSLWRACKLFFML
nr:MAG TPA: hypothetical protein [Caudoviricetes sp.]